MATENQIRANRANAAKSTGPSQNEARRSLIAGTVVFKAESIRRFNDLAADLTLQLQPRNSLEAHLVQTITAARWRLLRMWGIQTAAFELEMARASQHTQASGAVLAAIAFRALADTSHLIRQLNKAPGASRGLFRAADSPFKIDLSRR
jgi:hypothetical protein